MSQKTESRNARIMWLAVATSIAVSAVSFLLAYTGQVDQTETQKTKTETAQAQASDAADQATDLADQVLEACAGNGKDATALRAAGLCGQATVTKEQVQDVPARDGATGAAGAPGAQGPAGRTPTAGLLMDLIRGYLTTNPPAAGTDGSTGSAGPTGPQGPPGVAGQDGADGQDGAPGRDGADGAPGADGRGITALSCSGPLTPLTFTVTYSDGTTQDFTCGDAAPGPTEETP